MPRKILIGLTLITAASLATQIAAAQNIASVYKDRTVTILVGYGAGGTYGQTSLLLAQHLGEKIPGDPTVIVQHMPGAGGIKATNYAYNVMPKNGLNVMMLPEMSVVSQVLRPTKVKYKINNFIFLGRVFGAPQVLTLRRDSGIRSLDDMKTKEIIIAANGTGSSTYIIPSMMNAMLGTKFKIVTGYKGSAGTSLSMERGETTGMTNSWVSWKANRPQWFNKKSDNFAINFVQTGFTREPDLPNIPLLTELATNSDDKAAAAMMSTAAIIGRGLSFPPGVPANLVAPLRAAFWDTISDPAFKAAAKKRRLPVIPIKGAELQKTIGDAVAAMSPVVIAKARKYVFGK